MRVYEIGDYTKGLSLHIVERPDPVPGHGEVVMNVRATGVNARDLSIMEGALTTRAMPYTRVPLSDNAGDVLAVGPGVDQVEVGDRVTMTHYWQWLDGDWNVSMAEQDYAATLDGFLAEQVVVPAEALVKIPDSMTYEDASTLQSAGLTAWNAVVEAGQVRSCDTILTLGTGGVSVFGMQWAKMLGAQTIVTSSSDDKLERVRALGADYTINYRNSPDWFQEVLDLTDGKGVNVVLNNVGMQEMEKCLLSCASNGRVMYIGANPVAHSQSTSEPVALTRFPNLIIKDLTIKGIIVGSRRMFVDLVQAMTTNQIKPVIDKVFDFDNFLDAIPYMKSGEKLGKIVIRVQ
ncbi:MAG: zinc-dependent alcohol dehydrogenase family protein [Rhodospirillaceae bacterium]